MKKVRLDVQLVDTGLVESRAQAQRLVMAGQVRVDGQVVYKPSTQVDTGARISLEELPKYVSRGAEKLEAALVHFNLTNLDGYVCADVGASTGGFTDCLLAHGAKKVYAIDVGQNILHWKLRTDERVVVMEETNVRYLQTLPEQPDLVTIDVSFISLSLVLPAVRRWVGTQGVVVVALVKPQFEAGRKEAARGKGVIRDPAVHREVLRKVMDAALSEGYDPQGLVVSPLHGAKGNTEFLLKLWYPGTGDVEPATLLDEVLKEHEDQG